ncbi:MAG: hypothetical protein EXR66_01790 [Dehalococcoidia bacterium]|nr:hypothetical protein [Dehalococcoidia bacterium]
MASSSPAPPSLGWPGRTTLLPGHPLAPLPLYYLVIRGWRGFLLGLAFTTYGLYAVREAALSPFQLVLVGTAVELTTLLAEVPTGVIADVVSWRLSLVPTHGSFSYDTGLTSDSFEIVALGRLYDLTPALRSALALPNEDNA